MPDSAQFSHPGVGQLAAFAVGKLAGAERAALEDHLNDCPTCRSALASLPSATGGGDSVSGRETLTPAGLVQPPPAAAGASLLSLSPTLGATAAYRPGCSVPADLANHPRYEVQQLLGEGGMGAVYKARHKVMNRVVALKVMNAGLVGNAHSVERFHREVEAAAKLDHANIVRAHDADQAGDTHFLVMEFVDGIDLAKLVQKHGPVSPAHACHFIRQAALGLQHAHEHGMVHRDIKPHNLMLMSGNVVKVMDFGLARLGRDGSEAASDSGLTGENVLMGTADYIAPEQAQDAHRADIRADLYSLGCTLFHLLVGRAPFGGGQVVQKIAAHLLEVPPLDKLPAGTPEGVRRVVARLMEKDPAKRYQTPAELVQALVAPVRKPTTKLTQQADARVSRTEVTKKAASSGRLATRGESQPAIESLSTLLPAKKSPAKKKHRRKPNHALVAAIALAAVALVLVSLLVSQRLRSNRAETALERQGSDRENSPAKPAEPPAVAPLPTRFSNSIGMDFVLVPKGKFLMGGGGGVPGKTTVEIDHDFYLGVYEVTQGQWQALMGSNPSHFSRTGAGKDLVKDVPDADLERFPVEEVSWNDAKLFLKLLNVQLKEWRRGHSRSAGENSGASRGP